MIQKNNNRPGVHPLQRHLLEGVTVPLVTPLRPDGKPNLNTIPRVIDHVVRAGVDNIFLLGGNGEHIAVLTSEVRSVVRTAKQHLESLGKGHDVPLMCGTGGAATRDALMRGEAALEAGADALVVLPPFYFRHLGDEIVDHYRAIAELGAPVIAYNIPAYTNNPLTVEIVRELLGVTGLVGIKDSSGDTVYFDTVLEMSRTQNPAFGVSQGAERKLLWALRRGAIGITPGLANVAPELCVSLFRNASDSTAVQLQERLDSLGGIHRVRTGIAGTKAAMQLLGIDVGPPSRPFRALSASEHDEVERILRDTGVLLDR